MGQGVQDPLPSFLGHGFWFYKWFHIPTEPIQIFLIIGEPQPKRGHVSKRKIMYASEPGDWQGPTDSLPAPPRPSTA